MKQQAGPPRQREPVTELRLDSVGEVRVALDPYISVLALVTGALGRRRGAPEKWRGLVLDRLHPASQFDDDVLKIRDPGLQVFALAATSAGVLALAAFPTPVITALVWGDTGLPSRSGMCCR
jgi:hypothetical protein